MPVPDNIVLEFFVKVGNDEKALAGRNMAAQQDDMVAGTFMNKLEVCLIKKGRMCFKQGCQSPDFVYLVLLGSQFREGDA